MFLATVGVEKCWLPGRRRCIRYYYRPVGLFAAVAPSPPPSINPRARCDFPSPRSRCRFWSAGDRQYGGWPSWPGVLDRSGSAGQTIAVEFGSLLPISWTHLTAWLEPMIWLIDGQRAPGRPDWGWLVLTFFIVGASWLRALLSTGVSKSAGRRVWPGPVQSTWWRRWRPWAGSPPERYVRIRFYGQLESNIASISCAIAMSLSVILPTACVSARESYCSTDTDVRMMIYLLGSLRPPGAGVDTGHINVGNFDDLRSGQSPARCRR